MKIHTIHDDSDEYVMNILRTGLSTATDKNIAKNYNPDYSDVTGNLFYILKHGRYRKNNGKYFVITVDDKYVCSAGWNNYELETDVALVLSRMYVIPEYRGQYLVGKNILPLCIAETTDYGRVWATVNDYNITIYKYFERIHSGKRATLFNDWPEIYRQFKPLGRRSIYYTDQWVAELNRTKND
jgi:hypothetical protein